MDEFEIPIGYPIYFGSTLREGVTLEVSVPGVVSVTRGEPLGDMVQGESVGTTEIRLLKNGAEYRRVSISVIADNPSSD